MKIALNIVGVLLILFGAIWVLQGFNMFPGQSFMNGQRQWGLGRRSDCGADLTAVPAASGRGFQFSEMGWHSVTPFPVVISRESG